MDLKPCKRCSRSFYASHGNQTLCATCKAGRSTRFLRGMTYGVRYCDRCGTAYTAVSENQRYCGRRCKSLVRVAHDNRGCNPHHRGARARWLPLVVSGVVRCARGAACRRSELVAEELLGGFILPGERWHLGHADGESVGGPEHVACNTGAPSRLRARAR